MQAPRSTRFKPDTEESDRWERIAAQRDAEKSQPLQASNARKSIRALGGDLTGVEDRDDVGVLQAHNGLDLAPKSRRAEGLGQVRIKHLERDGALVPEIVGQIDRGHVPAPKLALESQVVRISAPAQARAKLPSRAMTLGWGGAAQVVS